MRSEKKRLDIKDAPVEKTESTEETKAAASSGPKLFTNSKSDKKTMAQVQNKEEVERMEKKIAEELHKKEEEKKARLEHKEKGEQKKSDHPTEKPQMK